jgi:hypothetical protein
MLFQYYDHCVLICTFKKIDMAKPPGCLYRYPANEIMDGWGCFRRHRAQPDGQGLRCRADEQKWPSFLEAFMHAIGGGSSILRTTDYAKSTTDLVATFGYDPAWRAAYCNTSSNGYLTPALNRFRLADAIRRKRHENV